MSLASPPATDSALRVARARRQSELGYQRLLAQQYRDAFRSVLGEMDRLGKYIETQKAKGAPVSPSWLMRQERYLALQSQLEASIRQYGGQVNDLLREQSVVAARDGLRGLREEVAGQMGATGRLEDIRGFGADVWGRIDQRAMDAALDLINQTNSPLNNLIQQMGPNAMAAFQAAFAIGMASGQNPNKIARNLRGSIQGMTQGRAQLIARTEWHRATRAARSAAFTDSRVVKAWIWRSALDARTCGICYVNHGTEHATSEMLPGHPGCRCVMVPKTVEWSELGLPGMGRTQPKMEPGASSFRRLPEARQRALLGRARYEAFKSGHRLRDLYHTVNNPTWGAMVKWKPLPKGGLPPPKPPPTSRDPLASMDDFQAHMMSKYATEVSGNLTWNERKMMLEAFEGYAKYNVSWTHLNRVNSMPGADLGAHPFVKGGRVPANYSRVTNEISIAGIGRNFLGQKFGYGVYHGHDGFKSLVQHELGHALHHSLSANLMARWNAIHYGTAGGATFAAVSKQLNRSIQLRAEAKREVARWTARLSDPYEGLDQAYIQSRIEAHQKVYDVYTKNIDILKQTKAAVKPNDDVFPSAYGSNNQFEDFAESAWRYLNTPAWLAEAAPARYAFFKDLMGAGK